MEITKNLLALLIIIVIVIFQVIAWLLGHDGTVTGVCLAILGGIVGVIFGFKIGAKPQ